MHVVGDIEGESLLSVLGSIREVDIQFHGLFVVGDVGAIDFECLRVLQQAKIDKGGVNFACKLL
eukprot:2178307-Ditylum_brightwellii.AAC.1